MQETEYAYGVARVRANENSLLTTADVEQLVSSPAYKDALRILADKGWSPPENNLDFAEMLELQTQNAWQLLVEAAPDIRELDALIITNDFHNLKAALKTTFSNETPVNYFITPAVIALDIISEAAANKNFDLLPGYMRKPAEDAYDAIVRLGSGRIADIIIDVAALNTKINVATESGSELLLEISQLTGAAANIKTALRSARTGKDADFMSRAMCECGLLDNDRLIAAALAGEGELISYLTIAFSEEGAAKLKESPVSFEKWCDEMIAEKSKNAMFSAFGIDPFVAYYIKKELESKNVRIILSAKLAGLKAEEIRKRVRVL